MRQRRAPDGCCGPGPPDVVRQKIYGYLLDLITSDLRAVAGAGEGSRIGPVLTIGVVALGVTEVRRAAGILVPGAGLRTARGRIRRLGRRCSPPPGGSGTKIALQRSQTPPRRYPRAAPGPARGRCLRASGRGGAPGVAWSRTGRLGRLPDDPDFVVLADPDGNRFCIVDLGREHGSSQARTLAPVLAPVSRVRGCARGR